MAPSEPQKLHFSSWPKWMIPNGKLVWIELNIPYKLSSVVRCNPKGKKDKNGKHWTTLQRKTEK
jgi:hypothetical protein